MVDGLMPVTDRLSEAFRLTVSLHGKQIRKGTGVSYITHLMAVSSLVGEYGGDEDLMIAGLLHDSLEDCFDRIGLADIVAQFGERVGRVVQGCSDCCGRPKPSWEQRKQAFVKRLATEPADIKLVAAADKLHNASCLLRDTLLHGTSHWERFNAPKDRQAWYLQACLEALALGWDNPILMALDNVLSELFSDG